MQKIPQHQINVILAHDLKRLHEDVKKRENLENPKLEVNNWEECDKAIIHSKELTQTETINTKIMQLSLEKHLAKIDNLEKTYHYSVHEIKKTPRKISKSSH